MGANGQLNLSALRCAEMFLICFAKVFCKSFQSRHNLTPGLGFNTFMLICGYVNDFQGFVYVAPGRGAWVAPADEFPTRYVVAEKLGTAKLGAAKLERFECAQQRKQFKRLDRGC
jgi:hypothetical protein